MTPIAGPSLLPVAVGEKSVRRATQRSPAHLHPDEGAAEFHGVHDMQELTLPRQPLGKRQENCSLHAYGVQNTLLT